MVPGSHLERGDRETWDLPQENGGDRGPSREELGGKGRGGAGSRPGGGGGTGRRGRRGGSHPCGLPPARTHSPEGSRLLLGRPGLGGRRAAAPFVEELLEQGRGHGVHAGGPGRPRSGDPAAQRAAHGGRGGAMATGARPPGGARARDRCSGLAGGAGRCGAAAGGRSYDGAGPPG